MVTCAGGDDRDRKRRKSNSDGGGGRVPASDIKAITGTTIVEINGQKRHKCDCDARLEARPREAGLRALLEVEEGGEEVLVEMTVSVVELR